MTLSIEVLRAIDSWDWLIYLASLSILFYLFLKNRKLSSSLVAVLITVVIEWCMDGYGDFLLGIVAHKDDVEQPHSLTRYAWYYGLAGFNAVLIVAVYQAHMRLKLTYSYTARYLITGHFVIGLLLIIRCFEQQSLHSDYLALAYLWGKMAIGVSCAGVALIMAMMAWYKQRINQMVRGVL